MVLFRFSRFRFNHFNGCHFFDVLSVHRLSLRQSSDDSSCIRPIYHAKTLESSGEQNRLLAGNLMGMMALPAVHGVDPALLARSNARLAWRAARRAVTRVARYFRCAARRAARRDRDPPLTHTPTMTPMYTHTRRHRPAPHPIRNFGSRHEETNHVPGRLYRVVLPERLPCFTW